MKFFATFQSWKNILLNEDYGFVCGGRPGRIRQPQLHEVLRSATLYFSMTRVNAPPLLPAPSMRRQSDSQDFLTSNPKSNGAPWFYQRTNSMNRGVI
jgi:hypothetical protein